MSTAFNFHTTLVSAAHGFDDYDVQGLPLVRRACIGHGIKNGDLFNVYCEGGVKLGGRWKTDLAKSLRRFAESHPGYLRLASEALKGSVGRHDWALGQPCDDGYPVFVDDRQLGYRKTAELARAFALQVIARLQAAGDYRLNDMPAGFLPPPVFTVREEDLVNVLRDYALRVANSDGKSFETMACELINEIDCMRVERAALDGGTDPVDRIQAAQREIKAILVELGVIEF